VRRAVLTSIGHNIADSLASGCGLLIGVYEMDVFGEAANTPDGFLEVDFLSGTVSGGRPSRTLTEAVRLYSQALPELCDRQGAKVDDFAELTARYSGRHPGVRFSVAVTDRLGNRSIDEYVGVPGARPKVLDPLGRVRRIRGRRSE
jgi:hypothetical protein